MVTMKQIDKARERVDAELKSVRAWPKSSSASTAIYRYERLQAARDEVDALLREWWAQGCREVEAPAEKP